MAVVTVPINDELEAFILDQMTKGFSTKTDVVRFALHKFREDRQVVEFLEARKEVKEGKVFFGDLDELAKKI